MRNFFKEFKSKFLKPKKNKIQCMYRDIPYCEIENTKNILVKHGLKFDAGDHFLYYANSVLKGALNKKTKQKAIDKLMTYVMSGNLCFDGDGCPIFFKQNYVNSLTFTLDALQEKIVNFTKKCSSLDEDDIKEENNVFCFDESESVSLPYLLDIYSVFIVNEELLETSLIQKIYNFCRSNRLLDTNHSLSREQEMEIISSQGHSSIATLLDAFSESLSIAGVTDGFLRLNIYNIASLIMFGFDTGYLDIDSNHVECVYVNIDVEETPIKEESCPYSLQPVSCIGDQNSDEGSSIKKRYSFLLSPIQMLKPEMDSNKIFEILHNEFPWMEEANNHIASSVAMNEVSDTALYFKPILLNGSPGIGKTKWSKRVAELMNVGYGFLSFAGISSSMIISGNERGWHHARPGFYVDIIEKYKNMNPVVLVDELDKGQISKNGDPFSALLPLLERDTSSHHRDNYLMSDINLSYFSYVLTSNHKENIPEALLDRLLCVDCRLPTVEEAMNIVPSLVKSLAETYDIPEEKVPDIDLAIAESVYRESNSIRSLKNNVENQFRSHFWKSPVSFVKPQRQVRKIGFQCN